MTNKQINIISLVIFTVIALSYVLLPCLANQNECTSAHFISTALDTVLLGVAVYAISTFAKKRFSSDK